MPASIKINVQLSHGADTSENIFVYYNASLSSTAAIMDELADDFEATIIPAWKAFLPDTVNFDQLYVTSPSFAFPRTEPLSGTGDLAVADSAVMPAWLPAHVRLIISGNIEGDTGAPYLGLRPVRSGGKYLSWLPETFNTANGFLNPGDTAGLALNAFLALLDNPLQAGGADWTPVVWSDAVAASGGRPARGAVVAPIVSAAVTDFTRLKSRRY